MTPQERVDRGAEAQRLIENPVYQEAKKKLLEQVASLRLQVPPRDHEGAMKLIQIEQTMLKTWLMFESFVTDARIAEKDLEKQVLPFHRRAVRRFRSA